MTYLFKGVVKTFKKAKLGMGISVLGVILSYSSIGAEEDPFDKGRRLFNQGAFKEAKEAFTECLEEEIRTEEARLYMAGMAPEKLKRLKRGKIEKLVQDSSKDETLGLIEAQLHLLKLHPKTDEQTGLNTIQSKVGTNGYAAYIMGHYHGGVFGGPENRRMAEIFYGLSDGLGFRAAREVLEALRREADREGPIGMMDDDGRTVRDIPEVDLDDLGTVISSHSSVIKGFEGGARAEGDDGLSALEEMSDIGSVLRGEERTPSSSYAVRPRETSQSEEEEEKKAADDTLLNPKYESLLKRHEDYAAALRGDALAQFKIGLSFHSGKNGLPEDKLEAANWYRKAAEQGDPTPQFYLGVMYATGWGVEQSGEEAVKWYRKVAEQGNAAAQNNLGMMYYNSQGVAQDYAEAVKWFRMGAAQRYANAQYNLGGMYANGRGVEKDDAEAVTWYRKAADQGYATAQFKLGRMYENGRRVAQGYEEAVTWYRKAADQGHAVAQFKLGRMYRKGRGVKKDYGEEVVWYRKAADQGHADAQYKLGVAYDKGLGVKRSLRKSATWCRKAAAQGHADAQAELRRLSMLGL